MPVNIVNDLIVLLTIALEVRFTNGYCSGVGGEG